MKYAFFLIPFAIFFTNIRHGAAQTSVKDRGYELYLAQIASAEAYLQLNLISEAKKQLRACDTAYRNIEWNFLHAALHQSVKKYSPGNAITYADVKVSPDGKWMAAAASDSNIWLFDYPGMELKGKLTGHSNAVSCIDFSNDSKKLVSGGRDHTVIVWDVTTGRPLFNKKEDYSQGIYQVRFSPDSKTIAVVSWEMNRENNPYVVGFAQLINAITGEAGKKIFIDRHPAAGVVFSPDAKQIYIASWGEIAYCFTTDSSSLVWKYDLSDASEYNAFHSIAIHPAGDQIVLGSTDHRVHILNSASGKVIHRIEPWEGHKKTVKAVQYSDDGTMLATAGEDQSIYIWDAKSFVKKRALIGHEHIVTALDWVGHQHELVSASIDGSLQKWDLEVAFETSYDVCDNGPWQTPLSPDKKLVAVACSDKKLAVYQINSGEVKYEPAAVSALCADISKDGHLLASASFDGLVHVWDLPSSKEIKLFRGHPSRVDGIAFLNKKKQVVSVGDTTIRIWNLISDERNMTVPLAARPFRINMSPDETYAYVSCADNSIRIFNTSNWAATYMLPCSGSIQEMTISPDGRLLAAFCESNIEIFDVFTHQRIALLTDHPRTGYAIGFSPDSKYLISGSYDQTFKLWNLDHMQCTLTYHAYENIIYNTKFLSRRELMVTSTSGKIFYYRY